MELTVTPSAVTGVIDIPGSKSHMIRALIIGALADGESVIERPLSSLDTRSAANAVRAFGASVTEHDERWIVRGCGKHPAAPETVIDVGNSGTALYMIMGTAALVDGWTVLTGDRQIRRRTAAPLIDALCGLGTDVISTRGNGCAPILVRGPMSGGSTTVVGTSSQYLSSLLLACPLVAGDSDIAVTGLNERPYVRMTLDWLAAQDILIGIDPAMTRVHVPGGQAYRPYHRAIPGDFSTATFPLCAAAIAGGAVTLTGLDPEDSQGDRKVLDILRDMGAGITVDDDEITVRGGPLHGVEADLNEIPDALPMLAVTACFAEGETVLSNVPQARIKETDRIAVMAAELTKLGADVEELPDGLRVRGGGLRGGRVEGHGDHRVVMALAVAGLAADGTVTVTTAEAAGVTWPGFVEGMRGLGAAIALG